VQRSNNEKDLKEGDANTKYFYLKASDDKKKNYIVLLQCNGAEIVGDDQIINR
jgi:hypothetical protein